MLLLHEDFGEVKSRFSLFSDQTDVVELLINRYVAIWLLPAVLWRLITLTQVFIEKLKP